MRIDEIIKQKQSLSFEVFPPKPEMDPNLSGIKATLANLRAASPDFVSVTYGAGGSNSSLAFDIAETVLSLGLHPLSHLTSVGYERDDAYKILERLQILGVRDILALRGDLPKDAPEGEHPWKDFTRASELTSFVSERGYFCVGGAAYPEGHQQSVSPEIDIEYMKEKTTAGASFFITQLFFDNDSFLRFAERAAAAGVKEPIIAGIMPVLRAPQIKRIIEISGCKVPVELSKLLCKYMDDDASMREAGIDYAARQISSLRKSGVRGIHIYTMNKSRAVLEILKRCDT